MRNRHLALIAIPMARAFVTGVKWIFIVLAVAIPILIAVHAVLGRASLLDGLVQYILALIFMSVMYAGAHLLLWLFRHVAGETQSGERAARREAGADEQLVPVAIPPLVTLLLHHEKKKGSSLTEAEVMNIRDRAVCTTMRRGDAARMAEKRGYEDISFGRTWEDWQDIRHSLEL